MGVENSIDGTAGTTVPPSPVGHASSLLSAVQPAAHPARIIHRVVAMAREVLGLEVSFLSEFAGGRRVIRYTRADP